MSGGVNFVLINLSGGGNFVFDFFPPSVETTGRANWSPQDVTHGAKPLFYMNRDARRLSVPDLFLDGSLTNESIAPDIRDLLLLLEETKQGAPPVLLAAWGDRSMRCVLEEVVIDEQFFAPTGEPLRAHVRLALVELQGAHESVTSQMIDTP
jgi:hypothetical protein